MDNLTILRQAEREKALNEVKFIVSDMIADLYENASDDCIDMAVRVKQIEVLKTVCDKIEEKEKSNAK